MNSPTTAMTMSSVRPRSVSRRCRLADPSATKLDAMDEATPDSERTAAWPGVLRVSQSQGRGGEVESAHTARQQKSVRSGAATAGALPHLLSSRGYQVTGPPLER